jgi:hypothetical protein
MLQRGRDIGERRRVIDWRFYIERHRHDRRSAFRSRCWRDGHVGDRCAARAKHRDCAINDQKLVIQGICGGYR